MLGRGDGGETFFSRLRDLARRPEGRRRGFAHTLRNRLLLGFLVAFPLVVTAFFAKFALQILDKWFRPNAKYFFGPQVYGVGLLLSLIALYLLGVIATNVFGGRLLNLFERLISKIQLLSPIYQGARQVTEAIQIRDSRQFQEVVLVKFPHPGVRSIGFVTREFDHPTWFADENTVLVFVPTTPNPTSGYLVAVPADEAPTLPISVEQGVKFVISGGLITPQVLIDLGGPALPGGQKKIGTESDLSRSACEDGEEMKEDVANLDDGIAPPSQD